MCILAVYACVLMHILTNANLANVKPKKFRWKWTRKNKHSKNNKIKMNKWLTLNKFRLVYDDIKYQRRLQLELKWRRMKREALVKFVRLTYLQYRSSLLFFFIFYFVFLAFGIKLRIKVWKNHGVQKQVFTNIHTYKIRYPWDT